MQANRTYNCQYLVTLADTNLVGNVYFTNYLRWQGYCREQFLVEHAPGVLRALTGDFALATVSCHCEFFSELYAADTVEVRMGLGAMDGHRITMTFGYYRINGETPQLVARGGQTIACMRRGPTGIIPEQVPRELRDALVPYQSASIPAVADGMSSASGSAARGGSS
jgi:enediyne core biosynthesis thioesterase